MTLKVSKDTHTKFGEARGPRGRAINFNKNLTQNFNASVDADVDADTNADAWASSIPLTSTSLRRGNKNGSTLQSLKWRKIGQQTSMRHHLHTNSIHSAHTAHHNGYYCRASA